MYNNEYIRSPEPSQKKGIKNTGGIYMNINVNTTENRITAMVESFINSRNKCTTVERAIEENVYDVFYEELRRTTPSSYVLRCTEDDFIEEMVDLLLQRFHKFCGELIRFNKIHHSLHSKDVEKSIYLLTNKYSCIRSMAITDLKSLYDDEHYDDEDYYDDEDEDDEDYYDDEDEDDEDDFREE
jgi:hypothetical protein